MPTVAICSAMSCSKRGTPKAPPTSVWRRRVRQAQFRTRRSVLQCVMPSQGIGSVRDEKARSSLRTLSLMYLVSGVPGDGSASAVVNALRDERASPAVAGAVADAVQERLVEIAAKVDVECSAISDRLSALHGGTRRGTGASRDSRRYVSFGGDRRPGLRAKDRAIARARPLSRISGVLQTLLRGRMSTLTVAEPSTDAPPPVLENPVSQACTQAQLDAAVYRAWCGVIREVPRYHRKQWEFCYILQALRWRECSSRDVGGWASGWESSR